MLLTTKFYRLPFFYLLTYFLTFFGGGKEGFFKFFTFFIVKSVFISKINISFSLKHFKLFLHAPPRCYMLNPFSIKFGVFSKFFYIIVILIKFNPE